MSENNFRSGVAFLMAKVDEPTQKIYLIYHSGTIKVNQRMGFEGQQISSLIMLGMVHRDPRGFTKLTRLLEQERLDLITVEISPYSRSLRAQQAAAFRTALRKNLSRIKRRENLPFRKILSHGAILGIFFLLKEPYEWRAAETYCKRKGIALMDIDLSSYAKEKLSHLPELISEQNLQGLLHRPSSDLLQEVESHYNRARFLLLHPPTIWPTLEEERGRDDHMAEKICSLARQAIGRKIVHIGGWEHLIDLPRGKSLFGLLQDLQPQRVLLPDHAN